MNTETLPALGAQAENKDRPSPECLDLMVEILRYAATVPQSKADIFVNFSAHVGGFDFKCHDFGYDTSNSAQFIRSLYLDHSSIETLHQYFDELKSHVENIKSNSVADALMEQARNLRKSADDLDVKAADLVASVEAAK